MFDRKAKVKAFEKSVKSKYLNQEQVEILVPNCVLDLAYHSLKRSAGWFLIHQRNAARKTALNPTMEGANQEGHASGGHLAVVWKHC